MRKRKLYILVLLIILIMFPYIKTEIYTNLYGAELKEAYLKTGMIDAIEYYKVLSYSNKRAEVFYVSKNHTSGNLLHLQEINGSWDLVSWETVWSTSGSASGFMWPYYR